VIGKVYGGIDPGKKGAIALLDEQNVVDALEMPETTKGVLEAIERMSEYDVKMLALEKPIAMPGQGTKTTSTVFQAYGVLVAGLTVFHVPFIEVAPARWKRNLDLTSSKDLSRERATQMFPEFAHLWKLKRQDGVAEAALLAYWAKTQTRRFK